jgi:hypothetical protein
MGNGAQRIRRRSEAMARQADAPYHCGLSMRLISFVSAFNAINANNAISAFYALNAFSAFNAINAFYAINALQEVS